MSSAADYPTAAAIAAGVRSGELRAAVEGAVRVARELDSGVVVTILPDDGSKYISLGIFN